MAGVNVHEFTDANFGTEVLQSDLPVLVDFTATWCGPCKALGPIVEQLADEMAGRFKVGTLDIDENPQVASKYGIRSVPTVLVFRAGEKTGQRNGLTNRAKLIELLDHA